MRKNKRLRQERECCCLYLLKAWSRKAYFQGLLAPAVGGITFAASCPSEGLLHSDICRGNSTIRCRQFKRFLKGIEDNFLCQVVDNPARVEAILDLMATSASKLINDIKI